LRRLSGRPGRPGSTTEEEFMSRLKSIMTVLALVATGSLASLSVATAQGQIEINPFAGYYIASDLYNGYGATSNSHIGLDNSFMWGGRVTFSSVRGGVEFAYTRTGSDATIQNTLAGQPSDKIGRVDLDNYDINFLGYQPSGNPRVTPFGLIGFGWAVSHPSIDANFIKPGVNNTIKSNTLFNFNFGLGTKIQMGSKVGLRLEGRWRVMDTALTTSSGIWCDPYGYCYSYASSWYNSGELIGGLTYALR
jgi:opacity protein-like surface antigen